MLLAQHWIQQYCNDVSAFHTGASSPHSSSANLGAAAMSIDDFEVCSPRYGVAACVAGSPISAPLPDFKMPSSPQQPCFPSR